MGTVLIVDDQEDLRYSLARIVAKQGCRATCETGLYLVNFLPGGQFLASFQPPTRRWHSGNNTIFPRYAGH